MKVMILIAALLGLANCTKADAQDADVSANIERICMEAYGYKTRHEMHRTASCICGVNAGLALGVYMLVEKPDGSLELALVPYKDEQAFMDEMLDDVLEEGDPTGI